MHPKTASLHYVPHTESKHSICIVLTSENAQPGIETETEERGRESWHSINKPKRNYFMTGNFR